MNRQSEPDYKALYESMMDAFACVDMAGLIVEANSAFRDMLGYSAEELARLTYRDLTPENWHSFESDIINTQVMRHGYSDVYEKEYLRKDGTAIPIEMRTFLIRDQLGHPVRMWAIVRDISERKRMLADLIESEERQRSLAEATFEGIAITEKGIFLDLNSQLAAMLGYDRSELIGKPVFQVIAPESHEAARIAIQTGVAAPLEYFALHRSGRKFPVEVRIRTLNIKGRSARVTAVRDITEPKRLREQLLHAQKMEAIGHLAGGIAHDFNNILNAILGFSNIIQMRMEADHPLMPYVGHIVESANTATQLIRSLLAFSRRQPIDFKPVGLNGSVRRIESLLRHLIGEDIEIVIKTAEDELTVLGDQGEIEQIFMNLATNARDAMPSGGMLTITTDRFLMEDHYISTHGYGNPGQYAVISVSDSGTGMDRETRERIFEPFFTTKELGRGTGLGLATVYGFVKQHNGYINVYSEPGKGSVFTIYLPLLAGQARKEDEGQIAATPRPSGGTETILIAEDDALLRKLAQTVLGSFGYTVLMAVDGEDAVAKFRENRDRIDLCVLDMIMPKKSGKEACEEIRALRPDIACIFMSGYTGGLLDVSAHPDENTAFLLKPVSPKELLSKVREVLDKRPA